MDRRSFLRSTGVVGAGLALSPSAFGQADKSKSDDINVALIGAGAQGRALVRACMKMGRSSGIHFKALCDIWERLNLRQVSMLLKKFGHKVNTYVDYREMLEKEKNLDAVIIATPDFCHAEQAIASLKAGLHVYCEAPMSNRLDSAREMVQAAKETGKLLQVGHQRRSNPRYIHCYENLLQNAVILGRITAVNGQWNRPEPDRGWSKRYALDEATLAKYGYKSMHQLKNWRWYRHLGAGPVVDFGTHQIDIFNWFLDAKPKSVTARGGTYYYDKKTHEWYDTVMAIYEYETRKGIVNAFYQTITTNWFGGHYEAFMGEHGTLQISEAAGRADVYHDRDAPDWAKWVRLGYLIDPLKKEKKPLPEGVVAVLESPKVPPSYKLPVKFTDPNHKPHLENFFAAVRGRAALSCPPQVGYETAVTILRVNEAVQAGHTLDFKPGEFEI